MNVKDAFSAAKRQSKNMVQKMALNAINVPLAIKHFHQENALIPLKFGKIIPLKNKP